MARFDSIITVTPNPAIDRRLDVAGFTVGAHQKAVGRWRTPGGKGVNVSRTLTLLGVENVATGFVGRDEQEAFERSFDPALYRPQFLFVNGQTRENITIHDTDTGLETHLRDEGFTVGEADVQRLGKKLSLLAKPGALMIFCGSLPPGLPPEAFGEMLRQCRAADAAVAADTSGEALATAVKSRLWLVSPNRAELAGLTGVDPDDHAALRAAATALTDRVEQVLLSLGEAGAMLVTAEGAWSAAATRAADEVGSTVGLGDALLAGYVTGCVAGLSGPDALREAVAVASATAVCPEPREFRLADLERLRGQVTMSSDDQ